ncbi:MAG: hypothetical protein ACI86M_001558 [Saprospiraceae bacterium]|jgi:hypothetical protein
MQRLIFFVGVLFSLLSFNSASAQNYLMLAEDIGLHGSVQLTRGNFENILAIQPGYTWNGRLTAGIDLGKGTDKIRSLTLNIVRPNLNYLIIKQTEDGTPVSINLETAYQYNLLPSTPFSSRSIQFGGTLFHTISIKDNIENFSLIPQVGLLAVKTNARNGFQVESGVVIVYNAGITVQWQKVYFEPTFFVNDGNISYSLKVGYIL